MCRFKCIALASLLITPLSIYAQNQNPEPISGDEEQELGQLLELLQQQTSLATKTRLNADYVPGMITVLHGDELENRGARTVWEALALVPGIEVSIEETGRKQVIVRGIGRTYASGNVKILLNGTSMNTAQTAYANPALNIPVEQVERIEVIRGPGSVIHGEFALTGVINVITRQQESRMFVMAAENSTLGAGIMITYDDEKSPLTMNLNMAGWETDGPDVMAGEDELYLYMGGVDSAFSNAPGPTNEAGEDKTAIFSLGYDKFSLTAQWLEDGYGDHFGRNQYLPPDEKKIVISNQYKTLDVKQEFNLAGNWSSELSAGWQDREQSKNDQYTYPAGSQSSLGAVGFYGAVIVGNAPIVIDSFYQEQRVQLGMDFKWADNKEHNVLLGVEYVDIDVSEISNQFGQSGAMVDFSGFGVIDGTAKRRIVSTTLQEEYRPNDNLTLTFGLRHDDYDDVGSSTTPRIAAVWRLNQTNILKAQYARAFRPPTFYEMAGAVNIWNPSVSEITPSEINTSELGYIYKNNSTELRLTLFNSKIDDLIEFIDQQGFRNTESATLYGTEFELKYDFDKSLNVDANLSYLNSKDNNTGESIVGSTDWIANLGINYQPASRTNLSLQYRYIDETYRQSTDTRDKLDAYATTDATLSLTELFGQSISFRAGIKNLFDEDVRYPAPVLTYVDDYPRAGRQWWVQLAYDF